MKPPLTNPKDLTFKTKYEWNLLNNYMYMNKQKKKDSLKIHYIKRKNKTIIIKFVHCDNINFRKNME